MGRINVTSQIFSGAFGPQQKFKVKVQTSNFKLQTSNIQIFKFSNIQKTLDVQALKQQANFSQNDNQMQGYRELRETIRIEICTCQRQTVKVL